MAIFLSMATYHWLGTTPPKIFSYSPLRKYLTLDVDVLSL